MEKDINSEGTFCSNFILLLISNIHHFINYSIIIEQLEFLEKDKVAYTKYIYFLFLKERICRREEY
jgi:hypothetical protein